MEHSVEVQRLKLVDGTELSFLLTHRGMKRLLESHQCANLAEFLQKIATNQVDASDLLWEALIDKTGVKREDFEEKLPYLLGDWGAKFIRSVLLLSLPNPPAPTPEVAAPVM